MAKVYERLQKQLNEFENKQDAEDCIKIYDKLNELNSGHVWESELRVLVWFSLHGKFPNCTKIYRPTKIGKIFLKGLNVNN